MNASNHTVTRDSWNFGSTSGSGIPSGYCIMGPFRFQKRLKPLDQPCGKEILRKGQLHGLLITQEECERLGLLYGYTQRYGRNTCRFVMSRAARKRDLVSTDSMYLRRQAEHAPTPF